MVEDGTDPQPEWRQPPEPRQRPFAPYDPTRTYGGPRDNPAPEELQVRPAAAPQPTSGGVPAQRGLSRRGALGLIAALAIGGGVYGALRNQQQQADLPITAATRQLELSTGSTDVELRGTHGTSGGSVTWDGSSSRPPFDQTTDGAKTTLDVAGSADELVINAAADLQLAVETGSGDIRGRDLVSRDLTVRTGSGDVELDYDEIPERVSIETGSGDVRIRLPQGEYAFDVSSSSGDIHGALPSSTGSGARPITIHTGSGDIDVEVG